MAPKKRKLTTVATRARSQKVIERDVLPETMRDLTVRRAAAGEICGACLLNLDAADSSRLPPDASATMTATRSFLSLSAVVAFLGTLGTPTFAFRAASSTITRKQGLAARHRHHRRPNNIVASTTALRLSSPEDEFPNTNSQEQEMMDQAALEEQYRQGMVQNEQQMPPANARPEARIDPLIASLTRIDEPTPANVPMVQAPLIGEIPADGNLAVLVPAAAISILGFIFSIVVAFNSRDSIVQEISKVELPKMEYTPTVVDEGKCRGLCSSQEEDLDGLRNFMESLSRKD